MGGLPHLRAVRPFNHFCNPGAGVGEFVEIDASLDTEAVKQIDDVFTDPRRLCIRTAAQAGDGTVYHADAVGHALAALDAGHHVTMVRYLRYWQARSIFVRLTADPNQEKRYIVGSCFGGHCS